MPEDTQAPDDVQDNPEAPEEGGPEGTTAEAPDVDVSQLQKSYDELRSKFNERDSELSQYRDFYGQLANPETQAEALRSLGLEYAQEDDDEEEYVDPEERWEQRFGQIEQYLTSQQEQQQEAELMQLEAEYLDQSIAEIEKENGKLSNDERQLIAGLADIYRDDDGLPDIGAAFEAFQSATKAAQQRYIESKKASKPDLGVAGTEKINLNDPNERAKATAAIIEATQQADEG